MRGKPAVIDILQRSASAESHSGNQYRVDAEWLDNVGLSALAAKMRAEANEESSHLQRCIARLALLDTTAEIAPAVTTENASVGLLLKNQLRLEMEAVELYTEGVRVSGDEGDYVSRALFESILADEESHVNWLESQLRLINTVGLELYIVGNIELAENG